MSQLLELALTAFVVGLSGALLPGPLLAATISESARRGGWTGPLVVTGHALLELAVVAAVCFGLQDLLGSSRFTGPPPAPGRARPAAAWPPASSPRRPGPS